MQQIIDQVKARAAQPAPKWFRKLKRAVSLSSNGIIVLLLAMGFTEGSLVMVVAKIGLSTAMQFAEAMLVDPDYELPAAE